MLQRLQDKVNKSYTHFKTEHPKASLAVVILFIIVIVL